MTNKSTQQVELQSLLSQISSYVKVSQLRKEEKISQGEYFNVFNILGLETQEVRVHSAFIAELLNPSGSHGVGNAFLVEFLKTIGLPKDYLKGDIRGSIVERSIGVKTETTGGRIDIIIEDGNNALIIENKVYALDQENQLLRYNNYAKSKFQDYKLIYLTLYGYEPSEYSTGKEDFKYICLSYSLNIIQWLQHCCELASDKPNVSATISQYIALIQQLTGQDMEIEKNEKEAIIKLAIDNLESSIALINFQTDIAKELREKYIIEPLKAYASSIALSFDYWESEYVISISKPEWKHLIRITQDHYTGWKNLYIHIVRKDGVVSEFLSKLDCMNYDSTPHSPFGWEWLSYYDWQTPNSFIDIKNGQVFNSLTEKINSILREIEEKNIEL